MSDAPHEVMSWDELGSGARELAAAVRGDGFAPDLILGIARGGLLVGAVIVVAAVATVVRQEPATAPPPDEGVPCDEEGNALVTRHAA